MEKNNEIIEFYNTLCDFPKDVHKDKETFYIYSHIDEAVAEKYAADPEKFREVFSLQECLKLPDWAREAVVEKYKHHGQMKKMLSNYKEYLSGLHIGGAGELSTAYGSIKVEDNVCMENLAACVSNLALHREDLEYMGDELPRWIEESEDAHMCSYEYTLENDDCGEVLVQNFITVRKDNHIKVQAGVGMDTPSEEAEDNINHFIDGMNDTDFPVLLKYMKTENPDTRIFEVSYALEEDQIYDILAEEENGFDRRDEAFAHILFGICYHSLLTILPRLLNVLYKTHTPEDEIMYYEVDTDEGCHYETPGGARYYFEHKILKNMFFEDPEGIIETLTDGGAEFVYDNFRQRCERRNIECPCKKEDFKVFPKTVEDREIVRIIMPLPRKEYDCFEIYLVTGRIEFEDDEDPMVFPYFFTIERGKTSKDRYLCEWDENGEHYDHGECTASANETLNEILSWVRC